MFRVRLTCTIAGSVEELMTKIGKSSDRPPELYGYVFTFFGIAISVLGTWISVIIVQYSGLSFERNFLVSMRLILTLMSLVVILPMSIAIEAMWTRWKNRRFRFSGVLASLALFLESLFILIVTASVFDLLFPGLYFSTEPFLGLTGVVLGLLVGLPMIAIVLTIKIPKVDALLKKAFE